jgi:hypothetical protein
MKNTVMAPISIGELVDKITILEIKKTKTDDFHRLKNIIVELGQLQNVFDGLTINDKVNSLKNDLYKINSELWIIEDSKRRHEREQLFDEVFIQLARNVYIKNDLRAAIKKQINILTNSSIIEEKIY